MRDKPIIFNTEMVKAILEGRKKQTRRVIKPQPVFFNNHFNWKNKMIGSSNEINKLSSCCRYQIGQTLWVRERFCDNNNPDSANYKGYEYYAEYNEAMCQSLIKWKPSIFMPRKAARLFLKVTNIRAERIQDISKEDAIAEGVNFGCDSVAWFLDLWDSINEKRGYGRDSNCYVWVIEFKKIN